MLFVLSCCTVSDCATSCLYCHVVLLLIVLRVICIVILYCYYMCYVLFVLSCCTVSDCATSCLYCHVVV